MVLPSSGQIALSQINVEFGRSSTATIGMQEAETGVYGAINQNSTNRPNGIAPHSMDEWYGYNHTAAAATGGIVTEYGNFVSHTFISSGTFTLNASKSVDVFIVAGGGGGGNPGCTPNDRTGGGGGAGGARVVTISASPGSYSVTVGAGGAAATAGSTSSTSLGSISATGGGRGAGWSSGAATSGGSGGGGRHSTSGAAGTSGQGNSGGSGFDSRDGQTGAFIAGGGGGAGQAGGTPSGGTGVLNNYRTGTNIYYAGGGGGSGQQMNPTCPPSIEPGGAGGAGGGGIGAGGLYTAESWQVPDPNCGFAYGVYQDATSGAANTGGGGGGGVAGSVSGAAQCSSIGAGGSGIVIFRYAK